MMWICFLLLNLCLSSDLGKRTQTQLSSTLSTFHLVVAQRSTYVPNTFMLWLDLCFQMSFDGKLALIHLFIDSLKGLPFPRYSAIYFLHKAFFPLKRVTER